MMLSKRNLSALIGDVVRNTLEILAQAEWRAEMEHRLCGGNRHSTKKLNTSKPGLQTFLRKNVVIQKFRVIDQNPESRP